jgi:hypothetical protein
MTCTYVDIAEVTQHRRAEGTGQVAESENFALKLCLIERTIITENFQNNI